MSETSRKRAESLGQYMVIARSPLYWVCRDQIEVICRISDMLDLPQDEEYLTSEELDLIHTILRDADDAAHEVICNAARRIEKEKKGGDGQIRLD